jgi:uncharacterized damage-inducible protein DinB
LPEIMSTSPSSIRTAAADREKLLALLRESRERLLASCASVHEEECRRRPAEGCWSVLDCVEHVAGAEAFMLRLVQGPRRPRPDGAPNREEMFLKRMTDRSVKAESPERGRPRGRFASLEEARRQFDVARGETIGFVEVNTEDLRATEVTHPLPMFGEVSAYEMLLIMAKHAERHALQIEEIKSAVLGKQASE